ncbi:MAG: prolyl oligopeptidase family serine peptidase [Bacteroidales bacterium]|nr:prolyl oligopeptidase family serine peptidase [Bacteroidales bacterium]
MKCLLIIICTTVLSLYNLYAQDSYFLVSGKVINNKDLKGIPFVNVYIEEIALGTVTNEDGDYELKVLVQFKDKQLTFSCIGYQTKKYNIKAQLNVNLKENLYEIDEVIVKPLKALELLQRAIAKIPENYPAKPVYYDAFYRSLMKEDSSYINLMEAACTFHYAAYTDIYSIYSAQKQYYAERDKINCTWVDGLNNYFDLYTSPNDQVKVIEARISEYNSKRLYDLLTVGGPLNLISADKVKYLNEFMSNDHFKHYKYKIEGRTTFNNRMVIIISFKPKALQFRNYNPGYAKYFNRRKYFNAEFEGKIYLDIKSYAFIRIEYNILKVKPLQKLGPHPYTVRIDYKKINNKWYLSQILRKRLNDNCFLKHVNIDTVSVEEQLIVNRIRVKQVNKFKKSETVPHSNYFSLYRYPLTYNKEYWDKYNIVTHNKLHQKAINDLERYKPLEQQFRDMQVKNDSLPVPEAFIGNSKIKIHDKIIIDEYKWLENINDENVRKYIKEENKYTYNYFIPLREKQNTLFKEMVRKFPEQREIFDKKKSGEYIYYQRYKKHSEYPVLCRKRESVGAKEEILFDFNTWANKYDNFYLHFTEISPNNKHIAVGIDKDGSEHKTCFFINIEQKTTEKDSINNIWGPAWANDSKTFYYVLQDSLNRPASVYKHKLGNDFSEDELIYREKDKYFDVGIRKSKLGNYIFLEMFNYTTSELWYINANKPDDNFKIFCHREKNHFYRVKESKNDFYILSNKDALNNRLFKTSKNDTEYKNWEEIIPASKDTLLKNFYVCENFLVLSEIYNVQQSLRVINLKTNESELIKFNEEFYSLNLLEYNYHSDKLKIRVSTFIKPPKTYEYNMSSKTMTLLKETKIKNFSPKDYKVKRVWSTGVDGTKIPVTLVYKKKILTNSQGLKINQKFKYNGSNPLILEAYGSFGSNNTLPYFSPDKFCMLDRGFIYAIAHVRGGSEMGKAWHENGKLLNKKNTFDDYISCAEFLINEHYTDSSLLFGIGGSAGGMLMGVVANRKPELFKGIILEYPQVCQLDALTDSTTMNRQEFGNPDKKPDFEYIYSYSPYENIKRQKYPAMLLISGLKDERVRYWQPTKMTARLRKNNLGTSPILLKSYNSGHTGPSGRDAYYRSMAFEYSFFLSLLE